MIPHFVLRGSCESVRKLSLVQDKIKCPANSGLSFLDKPVLPNFQLVRCRCIFESHSCCYKYTRRQRDLDQMSLKGARIPLTLILRSGFESTTGNKSYNMPTYSYFCTEFYTREPCCYKVTFSGHIRLLSSNHQAPITAGWTGACLWYETGVGVEGEATWIHASGVKARHLNSSATKPQPLIKGLHNYIAQYDFKWFFFSSTALLHPHTQRANAAYYQDYQIQYILYGHRLYSFAVQLNLSAENCAGNSEGKVLS